MEQKTLDKIHALNQARDLLMQAWSKVYHVSSSEMDGVMFDIRRNITQIEFDIEQAKDVLMGIAPDIELEDFDIELD